jgi:hypothetical protein
MRSWNPLLMGIEGKVEIAREFEMSWSDVINECLEFDDVSVQK